MSSSLDTSIDPRNYLRLFWRRKGVIALCTVTVMCTALIVLELVPEEYEAEATIIMEERQKLTNQLEQVMGGMRQPALGYRVDEQRMDELVGRVRSKPFLDRVVTLLRMHEDPVVREEAAKAVRNRPNVTPEEMAIRIAVSKLRSKITFGKAGSGVFRIIVADYDPQNAQLLAKWISELYVDVSTQGSLEQLRMAHEFGAEQLKIYEEQLRRSERALEQYKQTAIEHDLTRSVVRAHNVTLAENLYRKVLDEAELARMRVLPFSRAVTEAGLESERGTILNDPDVQNHGRGLATTLTEALTDRLIAEGSSSTEWPPTGTYVNLRRGLFQLIERKVAAAYPGQPAENRDALGRLVFAALDNEAHAEAADFLGQSISDFKRQAQSEPRGELELSRLESDVATNRRLLDSFQAQLVASDISQAMEMTNLGPKIEILDPPQVPLAPVRPARAKILLAAIFLGPVLGAGVAFAAELLDSTLRSLSDFQRVFSGPVLGTTPLLSRTAMQPGRARRYWIPAAMTGMVLLTVLFFLTRSTLLRDVVTVGEAVQVVDPGESVTP